MRTSLNILVANDLRRTFVKLSVLLAITLWLCGGQAQAAPPETMPVWRVQIYLYSADVEDAGTDDSLRVQLNDNNSTWLDGQFDDFERAHGRWYDLRLEGINQLRDIDYLRISKTGSDGWCLRYAYLVVNGAVIYEEWFNNLWLDNSGGHSTVYFLDDYFMRQRSRWINYTVPVRPDEIPRSGISLRIESLVGDFITGNGLEWGYIYNTYAIEFWTQNANTWHVDLDLGGCGEVDIDFDLSVFCVNGRPDIRLSNIVVAGISDCPSLQNLLLDFLNNGFPQRFNEMLKNYNYSRCPRITISPEGNLYFIPSRFQPPILTPPIATGFTQSPTEQDRQAPAVEIPDDSPAPLSLQVRTDSDIKPLEETDFIAKVKSNLSEDADVEVVIALPAPVSFASSAWVEVKDAGGARWLAPQVEAQGDGTTVIRLRDRLAAGKEVAYRLRVVFADGEAQEAQIRTRIAPVATEPVASLRAVTYFRYKADGINAEGTVVQPQRDKER